MNTHSAHIITEGFSAFIDGIPNDHECDSKGDAILIAQSGKVIYWHTYRQWASYTSEMRDRLVYEYHLKIDDPIRAGSVTCSVCKEAAINQAYWM